MKSKKFFIVLLAAIGTLSIVLKKLLAVKHYELPPTYDNDCDYVELYSDTNSSTSQDSELKESDVDLKMESLNDFDNTLERLEASEEDLEQLNEDDLLENTPVIDVENADIDELLTVASDLLSSTDTLTLDDFEDVMQTEASEEVEAIAPVTSDSQNVVLSNCSNRMIIGDVDDSVPVVKDTFTKLDLDVVDDNFEL